MPRFTKDQVVYWHRQNGNVHCVGWGIVDEEFSDAVCIDLLEPYENRSVIIGNEPPVPIDNFPEYTKLYKLPKNWTYSTELVKIVWGEYPEINIDITNPYSVESAYKSGYLVKASTKFHGTIQTDITREGWRAFKEYSHNVNYVSVKRHQVYPTYEEAKAEVDAYNAELDRQASLSDYEWSVEQIDKTLNRWAKLYGVPEYQKKAYRDWILDLKNVEDIEVRLSGGSVQWKYWKNKKWKTIEL